MATPPPLRRPSNPAPQQPINSQQPFSPQVAPTQAPNAQWQNQPQMPNQPQRNNSNKKWLIAGSILAAVLLIAAAALYFLTDIFEGDGYEYDDGNSNVKVNRDNNTATSDNLKEESIPAQQDDAQTAQPAAVAGSKYGWGTNGHGAVSIDLHIDSNGSLSGTYWNTLYNLEFNVSGHQDADNTLHLNLAQVKDGTKTSITLTSEDGTDYYGSWGKKSQPVHLRLYNGSQTYDYGPSDYVRCHITGPDGQKILNTDICFTQEDDGDLYCWYPEQGYQNRIKMDGNGLHYTLFNRNHDMMGTLDFSNYDSYYGVLYDHSGQRFDVEVY